MPPAAAMDATPKPAILTLGPRHPSVQEDNTCTGVVSSTSKAGADPEAGAPTPRSACLTTWKVSCGTG